MLKTWYYAKNNMSQWWFFKTFYSPQRILFLPLSSNTSTNRQAEDTTWYFRWSIDRHSAVCGMFFCVISSWFSHYGFDLTDMFRILGFTTTSVDFSTSRWIKIPNAVSIVPSSLSNRLKGTDDKTIRAIFLTCLGLIGLLVCQRLVFMYWMWLLLFLPIAYVTWNLDKWLFCSTIILFCLLSIWMNG